MTVSAAATIGKELIGKEIGNYDQNISTGTDGWSRNRYKFVRLLSVFKTTPHKADTTVTGRGP